MFAVLTHYTDFWYITYIATRYGRLAQLVRASGLHPECREFDPLTVQDKGLHCAEVLFYFKKEGMNEMTIGAEEMNKTSGHLSEISGKVNDSINRIGMQIDQFKV